MKVAPVSADLLIKLALGAAVVGAVYLVWRKASTAAGDLFDSVATTAGEVADQVIVAVNPADSGNLINRGVTAVGSAVITDPAGPGKNADGSWTLGGWFYDVMHGDQVGMMTTGKPKF